MSRTRLCWSLRSSAGSLPAIGLSVPDETFVSTPRVARIDVLQDDDT